MPEIGLTAKLKFVGDSAIAGIQAVGKEIGKLQTKFTEVKTGLGQIKGGLSGLGLGGYIAGLGIGGAVKKFADFDETMAQVRANLGESAKQDFPLLDNIARTTAANTGKGVATIAEALSVLSKKTGDAKETIELLNPTLLGMGALSVSAEESANILIHAMKGYDLLTKDAAAAMDTVIVASRAGKSDATAFSASLASLGGTANLLKIPMEKMAGTLATFSQEMDVREAAAGLGVGLMKIVNASKKGWIEFDKFGKAQVAIKDGSVDLDETLTNIGILLNKIEDPTKRANAVMGLFEMGGRNTAKVMDKLAKDPDALPKIFNRISVDSKNAAVSMAKIRGDTFSGKMKKLSTSIGNVAVEIGEGFLPFLNKGVSALIPFSQQYGKAFRYFAATPEAISKVGISIAGVSPAVAAVAQGLVAGFAGIKNGIAFIIKSVTTLGDLFGSGGPGTSGVKVTAEWLTKIIAVAGAYKLLAPVMKSTMAVGIGSAKILQGALGALGQGATSVIGLLGKKFPAISNLLPKGAGAIGKAVSKIEAITAQPVRVVNWNEAGMGGGIAATPAGAAPTAATAPFTPAVEKKGFTPGLATGAISAIGGGIALNLIKGELTGPVRTLGNTVLGISSMFGPAGMLVGGVAAGTLAFGSKIDEWTGLSDKISNYFFSASESTRKLAQDASMRAYTGNLQYQAMQDTANQFVSMARRGVAVQTEAGGAKQQITTELLQQRLAQYSKSAGMTPDQSKLMIETIMVQMGPKLADAIKNIKLETQVNVDGRPVAKGVATVAQENKSRRGQRQIPGERRRAAS